MDFSNILDNDSRLNSLGWNSPYHLAVHFPEQLIQAGNFTLDHKFDSITDKQIFISCRTVEDKLLIQFLNIIYKDISIIALNDLPQKWDKQKGMLFILDYYAADYNVPPAFADMYLTAKEAFINNTQVYRFPQSVFGLAIFLGFITKFIDIVYAQDNKVIREQLAAHTMQKAGVLAWRYPLMKNFAKSWATRIFNNKSVNVDSQLPQFKTVVQWADHILKEWGGMTSDPDSPHKIELCAFNYNAAMQHSTITDCIFADGDSNIIQILSYYYLFNIMAVYLALLNNKKYKIKD